MSLVGENIKRIRKSKNMSQKQLSVRANVSQSGISDIENCTRNPSAGTLKLIAQALDVPLSLLLGENEKKPADDGKQQLISDIIKQFLSLPQDVQAQAIGYAHGLLANRKD